MISIECTHVFFCVNKKAKGKCCATYGSESAFAYMKSEINRKRGMLKGGKRVKVVKTSCLGHCAAGPNIFISPDNLWYTFTSLNDIDDLINIHFINGEVVDRLINRGVHHEYI